MATVSDNKNAKISGAEKGSGSGGGDWREAVRQSFSSLLMPEHAAQEHAPKPTLSQFAPEYYDGAGRLKENQDAAKSSSRYLKTSNFQEKQLARSHNKELTNPNEQDHMDTNGFFFSAGDLKPPQSPRNTGKDPLDPFNPAQSDTHSGTDTIVFNGHLIKWFDPNGHVKAMYPAYSGHPGTGPADQNQHGGPLPEGTYWLDPRDWQYATRNPLDTRPGDFEDGKGFMNWPFSTVHSSWGDRRVPLIPDESTNTYGRDGFFVHGGDAIGSAGCIDVGHNDTSLIDAIKKQSGKIRVKVIYPAGTKPVPGSPTSPIPWSQR